MKPINEKAREMILHNRTISRYTKVVAELARVSLVEYGGDVLVHGGIAIGETLYTTVERIYKHLNIVSEHANSKYLKAINSSELYELYAEAQLMLEEVKNRFKI